MKYLYALIFVCISIVGYTQEFPFTLNYLDEPYVQFDDGIDAAPDIWNDPTGVVPIGFEFDHYGVPIESFMLTGLGAMLMSVDDGFTSQSIFLPYSSDITDVGQVTGEHTSIISYKTTGVEPERVFHMQWSDCAFQAEVASTNTAENRVSFQIRLYEGTNDIAIHYGPQNFNGDTTLHDGNTGPSIGLYANLDFSTSQFENYWLVGGETNDPQPLWGDSSIAKDNSFNPLNANPQDGTLYYFSTSMVSVESLDNTAVHTYPNPVSAQLNVTLDQAFMGSTYEVINMTGQAVLEGQFASTQLVLDVSALPSGMYFLRAKSGSTVISERFVKQ